MFPGVPPLPLALAAAVGEGLLLPLLLLVRAAAAADSQLTLPGKPLFTAHLYHHLLAHRVPLHSAPTNTQPQFKVHISTPYHANILYLVCVLSLYLDRLM